MTENPHRASGPRSSSGRAKGSGGLKALITVGAVAATGLGWVLYGQAAPVEDAAATPTEGPLPPGWAELLAPMPTLVPADSSGSAVTQIQPSAPPPQTVLRSVTLPTIRKSVTVTRSSR
jgi:hypothetical protein